MRRRRNADETGIDISPLIDMVFILLIFFMVTTTFVKDEEVELLRPSAQSSERASERSIRVQISAEGAVFVDGNATRPWMIAARIEDALSGGGDKDVLIVADKRITAEKLIDVVDQCRQGGAAHVGVATEQEAS